MFPTCYFCKGRLSLEPLLCTNAWCRNCNAYLNTTFCTTKKTAELQIRDETASVVLHASDTTLRAITQSNEITEHEPFRIHRTGNVQFQKRYHQHNTDQTTIQTKWNSLPRNHARKPKTTTIPTAEVVAIPLLQQYPICMSCFGRVAALQHHNALGTSHECGMTQKISYCDKELQAKVTSRTDDTTIALNAYDRPLKSICFPQPVSPNALLLASPFALRYTDDDLMITEASRK